MRYKYPCKLDDISHAHMREQPVELSAARPDLNPLVEGVRRDDGVAIETLYLGLLPTLRSYVYRRIAASEDADDFVGDCWAEILRGLHRNRIPAARDP